MNNKRSAPKIAKSAKSSGVKAKQVAKSAKPGGVKAKQVAKPAKSAAVKAKQVAKSAKPGGVKAKPVAKSAKPGGVKAKQVAKPAKSAAVKAKQVAKSAKPGGVKAKQVAKSAKPGGGKAKQVAKSAKSSGVKAKQVAKSAKSSGVKAKSVAKSAKSGGVKAKQVAKSGGVQAKPKAKQVAKSAKSAAVKAKQVAKSAKPGGVKAKPTAKSAAGDSVEEPAARSDDMQKDTLEQYDVVVIGGGPGGYAAALYGAGVGLKVALVEERKLGGTCLHVGCIPAKELLETASVYRTVSRAGEFGVNAGEPSYEWSTVMARKQQVIDRLTGGLSGLLGHRKVTVYNGTGGLSSEGGGVVKVAGADGSTAIKASAVILATGSKPRTIPGFEIDGKLVVTSDELLSIPELPRTAAVIGGGAIGCEFASMMADLGVEVTLLEALPSLLSGCDPDVVKVLHRSFRKRRVAVHTGVAVNGHKPDPDGGGTTVRFGASAGSVGAGSVGTGSGSDADAGESVNVDLVVVAVGRKPYTDGLGLEQAGVDTDDRGFVTVDERCRTSSETVWAVGDVIDTPQLAHTAFAEGMLAIDGIRGGNPMPIDYQGTPWCIYTHPEVAFSGHTEASAVAAGHEVVVSSHRYAANGRAMIVGETDGVVKVVAQKRADGTGGRILGVHMCGPWVTEQLGQGYLAVNWEATAEEVAALIQPHPTLSELFGEAVLSLAGRSLHG